ncbi:helix-turn-helix domain-containing protein [Nocardia sp. 004]|uniref:helix-turn-helix domain-containing protein n=1 Tax=Nocardia sp. 004 TaxID=3385978 RepID=UPI0039A02833
MDTAPANNEQHNQDTLNRMNAIDKALGAQIHAQRSRRGWSRKRLAEQTRSSKKAIAQMESGARPITVRELYRVCMVLRVEPRDLVIAAQAEAETG